jgi:hypothetical protein
MNAKPFLFLLCAALSAQADIYKCEINGRTVYQDHPSASCQATGIDTQGPNPEDMARILTERENNSKDYHRQMAEWEHGWIASERAKIDAQNERTRQVGMETDRLRAKTRAILNDIGVVHPPVYGTPFFPMPVVIVNPHPHSQK